jgi:hypothetical protein
MWLLVLQENFLDSIPERDERCFRVARHIKSGVAFDHLHAG